MSNEQHASTAPDIDSLALDVARRFTEEWDPQRRASLQVAIIQALRTAHPRPKELAEQEGDARGKFEAWARPRFRAAEAFERIDGRPGGWEYNSNAVQAAWAAWQAALAARRPETQIGEAAILRRAAAVLDMWEGDPNVTGYMGDFKDACAILELLAVNVGPSAQGIELGQVREIRIPARNRLDPISVFVQDQAVGRGRIVITCYGNAWQGFWNAMGDRTVIQFVAQCDRDYVAGSMLQGRQTRIAKHERDYATRIAAEVIAEFRTLMDGQRDAAPGVGNG